jgi:hypothetical protein
MSENSQDASVAHHGQNHVRIHIDQERYESPNPTTGAALYKLGQVQAGFELYRELSGEREDQAIPGGSEIVHLREDEKDKVAYWEVVKLAFPGAVPDPRINYTVMYKRGPKQNPEGSLVDGQMVHIQDGMIFHVSKTDRS